MATILYFLLFCRLLQRNVLALELKIRKIHFNHAKPTFSKKLFFFSLKNYYVPIYCLCYKQLILGALEDVGSDHDTSTTKRWGHLFFAIGSVNNMNVTNITWVIASKKSSWLQNITHTNIRLFSLWNASMMWMTKDSFFSIVSISWSWSSSWTLRSSSSK